MKPYYCTTLFRIPKSLPKPLLFSTITATTTTTAPTTPNLETPADVLLNWGCTPTEITQIFTRRPALRNADLPTLTSKLTLLRNLLHLSPSHLVSIIHRRPRFLSYRLPLHRLPLLLSLFGSPDTLLLALVRNPSLLTYDFHSTISPVLSLFSNLGISRPDLVSMLLSRPTLIPRSSLCPDKLNLLSRTNLPPTSKMYKHVVSIVAISRLETLREKLSHFTKFGFSEDEVLGAIAKSPLLLTLSTEKVQRNMTFVVGTMRLPAKVALDHPFLLFFNLEAVLRPRMMLAGKIDEMGVEPRIEGDVVLRALRMAEKRFVKAFIGCHCEEVREELMKFYVDAKGVKRLAASSKKNLVKGFPF